jgi:serine/threonine-protein kinase
MTPGYAVDLSEYFVEAQAPAEPHPEPAFFDPKLPSDLFVGPASSGAVSTSESGAHSLSVTNGGRREKDPDAPEPGSVIDKYRIEELVGAGGFALVYRATHLLLRTVVALKLLRRRALRRHPNLAEALCDEARLAARVTHPNVVRVLDVTHTPRLTYLVIEFVEGGSLADLLRARRMTPMETVHLGIDVAEGLRAALARGLIHRDIKPGNILLTASGMAKVGDLGLARLELTGAGGSVFDARGLVGTPGYMAPEQSIDSRAVDCRADMYSLGVTLFHAVVGEPPFPLTNRQRVLELHRTAALPRPSSLVSGIPEGLERIILRLTEKTPARRYESYDELLRALRTLVG